MPPESVHPQRASITSRIAGYNSLIIIACLAAFAWLMHTQLHWSAEQQADALGQSLLQHTHTAAEDALAAEDTLSVAVLLRELVNNPYVSYAALHGKDNRILAEAGQRPKTKGNNSGLYSKQLFKENQTTGSLHLQIDMRQLQEPMLFSMQSMAIVSITLFLLALFLSIHLGRSVALPLKSLSNWLINPAPPAPYIQHTDEIGLLARQLNKYFLADTQNTDLDAVAVESMSNPQPEEQPVTTTTNPVKQVSAQPLPGHSQVSPPNTTPVKKLVYSPHSAILAVELGNMEQLRQLPPERLTGLLKKYRYAVEQAAHLYDGQLHPLADGRSIITFNANLPDYPLNALCCGELLRAFAHHLQLDITDTDINVQVQLGLSEGSVAKDATLGELLLSESAQTALTLSQYSRNLLLLSNSLANNATLTNSARIRSIANPAKTSCLETLLEPYPTQLETQLHRLQIRD